MEMQLVPEFTMELELIRKNGITKELLYDIIQKHTGCADYNKNLYKRYMAIHEGVPIHTRQPKYEEEEPINNKINIDHFGEIVDFKVGYFAGEPISYSYNDTEEAEEVTGGEKAVDGVIKALTDFLTRNNMHGVDMEITKNASIYGYSGRLFFVKDSELRVKAIHGFETIILSDVDISEPEYAIRYYRSLDVKNMENWTVEFYDNRYVTIFKGNSLNSLEQEGEPREHLFDYCPLQGIANNAEKLGDAEKVIEAIDDYDRVMSDNSNEIEAFANALLLVNLNIDEEVITKAQKSGSLIIPPVGTNQNNEPVKWLTKNINDSFAQNHLERLESDIYSTTNTPNLKDATFGESSGEALRFKLHGLETKCSKFEACNKNSAQFMWKIICSFWKRQGINADPLQFSMEFRRNFPLELLKEAQTVQTLIAAGLPKRYAFSKISDIDDIDYIMDLIKTEKEEVAEMYPNFTPPNKNDDDEDENNNNNNPDIDDIDEEEEIETNTKK